MQQFFDQILEKEAQLLNLIVKLTSLQSSWILLYLSAVPRINHLLRTVPPNLILPLAQAHDNAIFGAFAKIFGMPSESSLAQSFS